MFDNGSDKGMVLSWRGPLLAAGIFAAVFVILLLMAHQNQSNTSDMGSSLRQDPYGTSLLFDSYGRAGYEVKRSQDEDSLSDQNALATTAFFIGGHSSDAEKMETGNHSSGEKFRRRLEDLRSILRAERRRRGNQNTSGAAAEMVLSIASGFSRRGLPWNGANRASLLEYRKLCMSGVLFCTEISTLVLKTSRSRNIS